MPVPKEREVYKRSTAKERVYLTLRQWIIDGTLQPEERLNDTELAEYFSVSRTPVREAIQMLSEQKLVHIIPSSGTFVSPIDPQDMAYVYQLLGKLQAVAIDFCISTLDEQKLDHLTRLNEKFLELAGTGSSADIHAADRKFHNYLAQLSENPYLISFTDQLTLQACRNENQFFKNYSRQRTSYENHRRIIDALIKRDLKTAQKEAEDNWLISIDYES